MITATVLAISICLQFAAALLALRLVRITGARLAWTLIAVAISLMAARRAITFFRLVTGDAVGSPDLAAEWVALAISLLMLCGVGAVTPIFRAIRRNQGEMESQSSLLRTIMDNTAEGFSVVDGNLNVVGFNQRFIDLLGFPSDLITIGTPFEAIIQFNAERGEYGPGDVETLVRERVELARKFLPHVIERTRLDGTVLEIRGNPVPGGGFVTTYADITQRRQAEENLRANQRLLQTMIDTIPHAIYVKDADSRFILSNRAMAQLHNLTPEQMVGLHTSALPAPTQAEKEMLMDMDRQVLETRGPVAVPEVRITGVDGQRIRHITKLPLSDNEGNITGIVGISQDITQQKQTEEALRDSQNLLQTVFDAIPHAIFVRDVNFRYRMVNATLAEFYGLPANEIVGRHIKDMPLGSGDEQERVMAGDRRVLETGEAVVLPEETRTRPDGQITTRNMIKLPLKDDEGNVVGIVGISEDVTERKRAEAELIASREAEAQAHARLSDAIESLPTTFALWDAEDRLVLFNNKVREMFPNHAASLKPGTAYEELLRITYEQGVIDMPPEEREATIQRRMREHKDMHSVIEHKFADGRIIETYHRPTSEGGTVSIRMDITERRKLEAQLQQAQKMEAVGQLTGGIAHDFNNLLTVVLGNLQLLQTDNGEKQAEFAANAKRAAEGGAMLTQQLLAFSRKQALQPAPTNIADLLTRMTELLHRTLGETIQIENIAPETVEMAMVDAHQLENCVVNLAVNARDAMPNGGTITFAISSVTLAQHDAQKLREIAPGEYLLLEVRDTGDGMTPETQERAIEPFFTTKIAGLGSGLGLSMIYGFVQQSGGGMVIESEPGGGTIVKLYLPRAGKGAIPHTEKQQAAEQAPAGRGETILIVEDDDAVRQFAVRAFESLGYVPVEAADSLSALAKLEELPEIALLFTDVVLAGGMSGVELAQEARRRTADLKVLYTTGYVENELLDQVRENGSTNLIEKPYDIDALARTVRAAIDRRDAAAAS